MEHTRKYQSQCSMIMVMVDTTPITSAMLVILTWLFYGYPESSMRRSYDLNQYTFDVFFRQPV